MMHALDDLSPVVLCDLIGVQPRTAERFAVMAGENWSDYLAAARPRGVMRGPGAGERS